MQKEDLEEKWREIQQTKLSKENQRSLGESSQTSASQEFSALDKVSRISLYLLLSIYFSTLFSGQ